MSYTVKVGSAEDKINEIEGFKVKFTQNGVDVRSDRSGVPQYSFNMRASKSWTVSEWKLKRFKICYPGYDVKVFDKSGQEVLNGQTKLENIR